MFNLYIDKSDVLEVCTG